MYVRSLGSWHGAGRIMKISREVTMIAALCGPISLAEAQLVRRPAREYVPIPFDGDLERMLRERLQQSREWDEILKHMPPQLKPLTPALEKLKDNEKFRELLRDLLKKEESKNTRWPESLKDLEKAIKKEIDKRKTPPVEKQPPDPVENAGRAKPPQSKVPGTTPPVSGSLEKRFDRWVKEWLKNTQDSDLGNMLRDSPAWRQTIEELSQSLGKMAPEGDRWTELLERWPVLDKLQLPSLDIEAKLPELSLPNLRKLSLPSVRIDNPLGSLRVPTLPAPGFLNDGIAGVYILAALAAGLILWQVWKSLARNRQGDTTDWNPGPWPMSPAQIVTREDFVCCFDYLALLLLGPRARSWHHQTIGAQLAGNEASGPRGPAAQELASIYEWARYAPGQGPLPPGQLEQARQALALFGRTADRS